MSTFYYFIGLLLGILTLALVLWKAKLLHDISTHPFSRFVGRFLLLLLALIAFLFGIHSEIFSSYDKLNSKINHTYNWFNPVDIAKFPIEQLGINNECYPKCEIDVISAFKSEYKNRKYCIVIDKTKSTDPTEATKKFSLQLIASIKKYLGSTISLNTINFDNISLEDLFFFNALERLAKDTSSVTSIQVMYYFGDDITLSPFNTEKHLNSSNLCEIVLKCLEFVQKEVNPKALTTTKSTHTDFKFIAEKLKEPTWCGNNNNSFSGLVIFSDFEHEEETGNSFESVNQSLQNLCKHFVTQVSLIKLKGGNKHSDWSNQTLDLFRETFNHLYYYEFDEQLKESNMNENEISYSEQIASVFSSVNDDLKPQPVLLYYSWNNEKYNFDYKGVVTLKRLPTDKKLLIDFGNRIDVLDYGEKSSYLFFKKQNQKQFPFRQSKVEFNSESADTLLFITNDQESKNYFFEINKPGFTQTIREPVILRQVLPVTTCIYLIYIYSLLGLGFISIAIYFFLCLFVHYEKYYNIKNILVGILAVLFLVLIATISSRIFPSYEFLFQSGFSATESILFSVFILLSLTIYVSLFIHSFSNHSPSLKKLSHEK